MNKKIFASLAFILSVLFSLPASENNSEFFKNKVTGNDVNKFKILMFGDSITALRGKLKVASEQIQEYMDKKGYNVEVINAGIGGNTTVNALNRFSKDVLSREPDIVFIMFGTNDAFIDIKDGKTEPRVAKEKYIENVNNMVDELLKRKVIPVLMTSPPMVMTKYRAAKYNFPPYSDKGFNFLLAEYVQEIRNISKNKSVDLIDNFKNFQESFDADEKLEKIMPDGMHPGQAGQDFISEAAITLLSNKFKNFGIK